MKPVLVALMLASAAPLGGPAVSTPRLYVLDCGMLNTDPAGVTRYHVTQQEVGESRMPVPCFLIVHPKGTRLWDVGVIPDADVEKAAPGHTPGHQVLILQLARMGRVMIAGDLYHYAPERTFHRRPPDKEFDVEQSAASRALIETYLAKAKMPIWIQYDFKANAALKKSPTFYD